MVGYIHLLAAICAEVFGTTCMKLSKGFSKLTPSVLVFVGYTISLVFLTYTLKRIEMSVAYAVWSGVGTALVAIIGIAYFKETLTVLKIASLALIVVGVVGLHLADRKTTSDEGDAAEAPVSDPKER